LSDILRILLKKLRLALATKLDKRSALEVRGGSVISMRDGI